MFLGKKKKSLGKAENLICLLLRASRLESYHTESSRRLSLHLRTAAISDQTKSDS